MKASYFPCFFHIEIHTHKKINCLNYVKRRVDIFGFKRQFFYQFATSLIEDHGLGLNIRNERIVHNANFISTSNDQVHIVLSCLICLSHVNV